MSNENLSSLFSSYYYSNKANAYELFRPMRAIQNPHESTLFIKRLLTVAICNLIKLRGVLPESAFHTFYNRDFEANVLVPNGHRMSYNTARYIERKILGSFDAISKRFIKQLKIRILSRDRRNASSDKIELYTFDFSYDVLPLITFSCNGTPRCHIELKREGNLLVQSVNALLSTISEMGTALPQLTSNVNPKVTMWMKKTDDAPYYYYAPGYGPVEYFSEPLRYPARDSVIFAERYESNIVNTGFNQMRMGYEFMEGDFGNSQLFLKYYPEKHTDVDNDE